MDPYRETFRTWNNIAKLYEDKFMNVDLYNGSYDAFCERLPAKTAKVLDVACGPGNITRYLFTKLPELAIVGIDVAANMITLAKKNNPTARFEIMDCRAIASLQERFDGIISGFFIPYLSPEEVMQFIGDSYSLLNDRGVIYLSYVDGPAECSGYKTGKDAGRVYFYYHQTKLLHQMIQEAGFKDILVETVTYNRSETVSEVHSILIAVK